MKVLAIRSRLYKHLIKKFVQWLKSLNYSDNTVETYKNQIREFLWFLETEENIKGIQKLNLEHVKNFHESLKQRKNARFGGGLSASHINGIAQTVNQFLKFLRLAEQIKVSASLKPIKEEKKEKDIPTLKEMIQLLDSINTDLDYINFRTKAMLAIFYGAGLRKAELENLKVEDILMEEQLIHVKKGKGRKERIIPVPDKVIQYIQDYIEHCRDIFEDTGEHAEDYLFIDVMGKKMNEDAIYKTIKDCIENSGIRSLQDKKITPHTFRHSFATHLMDKGMDIEDIARLLGHSSLDSTMIYTHIYHKKKYNGRF
jgi:site-specific recombinase XerD